MSFESIGRTIGGLIGTAAGGFAGMDAGIIAGGGVGAVSGLGVGSIVTAPAGAIAGGAAGLAAGGAAGNALGKTAGAGAGRWIDNQILEARKADDKAKKKDETGTTAEDCAGCKEKEADDTYKNIEDYKGKDYDGGERPRQEAEGQWVDQGGAERWQWCKIHLSKWKQASPTQQRVPKG